MALDALDPYHLKRNFERANELIATRVLDELRERSPSPRRKRTGSRAASRT